MSNKLREAIEVAILNTNKRIIISKYDIDVESVFKGFLFPLLKQCSNSESINRIKNKIKFDIAVNNDYNTISNIILIKIDDISIKFNGLQVLSELNMIFINLRLEDYNELSIKAYKKAYQSEESIFSDYNKIIKFKF